MVLLQLAAAPACAGALATFAPAADSSGSRPAPPGVVALHNSNYTQAFHLCTAHGGNGNCLVKGRQPSGVLARQGEQIKIRKLPRTVHPLCREKFPVA